MELRQPRLRLAGLLILAALTTACTEKLDNTAGCPILCSGNEGQIETVTIDAVALDTTISALTGLGTETSLLVATRGDTLDARAIIRFDSIPTSYRRPVELDTVAITQVDSVLLRMIVDTTGGKLGSSVTLDFYDVDTQAPDTLIDPVAALFTPERLLASRTFERTALKDTIQVQLPGSVILDRRGGRLRLGIRARGPQSTQLRILSQEGAGTPTVLSFRVSPDTAIARIPLSPFSRTPEEQPILAGSLADYTLLVRGTATGAPGDLNVGGLPARRVYMRFDIPAFLLDSVDIVRASLVLTQIPNPGLDPADTVMIIPHVSLAGVAVRDVAKASQITAIATADTLRVLPAGSGPQLTEIASIFNLWRTQSAAETPRAIVLLAVREGQSPLEARFHSIEAAPDRRPRLRISYSTRKATGLP